MPPSWDSLIPGHDQTFKQKIIALYIDDNRCLDGAGSVREYMKEHYRFEASTSTYRRKFLSWNVKKNDYPTTLNRLSHNSVDSGYGTTSPHVSTVATSPLLLDPASPFSRASGQSFLSVSLENRMSSHMLPCYPYPDSQPDGLGIPEIQAANDALDHGNTVEHYTADEWLSDFYSHGQPSHLDPPTTYQPPHAAPSRCPLASTSSALQGSGLRPCEECRATKLHHLASVSCRTDVVVFKEIVDSNPDSINQVDYHGNSCIHFAAGVGASLEQLKILEQAGACVTRENDLGQTMLHILDPALYGEALSPVLCWASRLGASLSHRDHHGKTPLHHILGRHLTLTMIQHLTPFLRDVARSMAFLDRDGNTPYDVLWNSWQKTNRSGEIAQLNAMFIANGIPITSRRSSSTDATSDDLHQIIDRSLYEPYCQDSHHRNILHALAYFSSPTNQPQSPFPTPWGIWQCLQHRLGNYDQVGIDLDQYNRDGFTPLHSFLLAASYPADHELAGVISRCVELLYEYGANPWLQDRYGNNAWTHGLDPRLLPTPL